MLRNRIPVLLLAEGIRHQTLNPNLKMALIVEVRGKHVRWPPRGSEYPTTEFKKEARRLKHCGGMALVRWRRAIESMEREIGPPDLRIVDPADSSSRQYAHHAQELHQGKLAVLGVCFLPIPSPIRFTSSTFGKIELNRQTS